MNIVISGLGEVGMHMARKLSQESHAVSVIEIDERLLREMEEVVDAKFHLGSATSLDVLRESGAEQADLFLALTSNDPVNVLSAALAKQLGAKRVVARCHATTLREYRDEGIMEKLGVDDLISPELIAAGELARLIRSKHSPVLANFARGAVEALALRLGPRSRVVGKRLVDLKFPPDLRVGFVSRQGRSLLPTPDFEFVPGDQAVVVGKPETIREAGRLLDSEILDRFRPKITIYGADDVGVGLVSYFSHDEADIKLIDPSEKRLRECLNINPRAKAVQGEATNPALLIEESVIESDYFIAATRDDENNVMACLQAVKLGVSPVMLVIHRPDYAGVLSDLGDLLRIEAVISPRVAVADELQQFASRTPFRTIWKSPDGEIEIIQTIFRASEDTDVRHLGLPPGTLVISVEGAEGHQMPGPDSRIRKGDGLTLLIAVSSRETILQKVYSAKSLNGKK